MDNLQQIEVIKRYHQRLTKATGIHVSLEAAALIWIRRYAESWRMRRVRELHYS